MKATQSGASFFGGALALSTATAAPWAAPVIGVGALGIWAYEKYEESERESIATAADKRFLNEYQKIYLEKVRKWNELKKKWEREQN